jgi:spore germination protein GerM
LNFIANATGEGKLVLSADNPSGLPQYDASVSIPVRFVKTDSMIIKAYFSVGDGTDCSQVASVNRTVSKTSAVANAALVELLKGPTQAEVRQGFRTNITAGTKVQKIEIRNGVAYVDFNSTIEQGGGSCAREAIIAQVTSTLKQFSTIKTVVISVNGRTEDILQP